MPLTNEQRAELKRILHAERDRLSRTLNRSLRESRGETEHDRAGDISTTPFHPADLGTDNIQMEIETTNMTRVSRELAEIDDAIERLARNPQKFGICEDTGADIPYGRLLVVPWARTCDEADAPAR